VVSIRSIDDLTGRRIAHQPRASHPRALIHRDHCPDLSNRTAAPPARLFDGCICPSVPFISHQFQPRDASLAAGKFIRLDAEALAQHDEDACGRRA